MFGIISRGYTNKIIKNRQTDLSLSGNLWKIISVTIIVIGTHHKTSSEARIFEHIHDSGRIGNQGVNGKNFLEFNDSYLIVSIKRFHWLFLVLHDVVIISFGQFYYTNLLYVNNLWHIVCTHLNKYRYFYKVSKINIPKQKVTCVFH